MDEDSDSSSWASDDGQAEPLVEIEEASDCLFCSEVFPTYDQTFSHIKTVHQIDVVKECYNRTFDSMDYIKLINYIRKEKVNPSEVFGVGNKWRGSDTYMQPTLQDDKLLRFGKIRSFIYTEPFLNFIYYFRHRRCLRVTRIRKGSSKWR